MSSILNILGLHNLSYSEFLWVAFGTAGQLIFFSRWVIQWLLSEKSKVSHIPLAFWWCSLFGGLITLIYAHHIGSFPFMLAQAIGIIVYSRNLILINRRKNEKNS
ncbi:lipid-A-disaccharide synthase N-terminal domain-containing protein [Pelagibacteraceae bacterium]|nr:lipid-A-disaccharide synthase N-terminal domain-containing protein [Pelagibacteraceae bacterium]